MLSNLAKYFKGDIVIWIVIAFLTIISIVAVFTSTGTLAYKYQGGNTWHYMMRHTSILFFGLLIIFVTHRIPYLIYSRLSLVLMVISIPLLFVTLIIGASLNEASRWLQVPGLGLSFQTSDLAKFALIMFVARFLSQKQDNIKDFKSVFRPLILIIVVTCFLIFPANFSTAVLLFSVTFVLMFVGRVNVKYLVGLVLVGVSFVVLMFIVAPHLTEYGRVGTWMKRIENFNNPESKENFQADQSKIAIATGGITGKGPGKSTQRNFLPHPYSDFIYAIIIEEYGIFGAIVVIILYMVLLYRSTIIVKKVQHRFAAFVAIGLSFSLVFQAFVNMAVAVNILPVTGQTLPFLSMGGTSIFFTAAALGVILSVSRDIKEENLINNVKIVTSS
jgi:cell division protein FtsW